MAFKKAKDTDGFKNALGALDHSYWNNKVKNASNLQEALSMLDVLMSDAGWLGVSDNDQRTVTKIIKQIGDQYNLDVSGAVKIWDPDAKNKNSINSLSLNSAIQGTQHWIKQVSDSNYLNTPEGQFNASGASVPGVGDANGAGTKAAKDTINKNNPKTNTQTNSGNYGSGGGGGGYTVINNPNALTKDDLNDFSAQLKEYFESLKETKPEPKSAAEIARIHSIDYNLDNILADYNNATNEYYDNAIKEQNALRNTFNKDNAFYVNDLMKDYYDSYQNQAATAINKGNLAANMLATNLAANDTNSATDLGMLQSINQLDEARKAELLQNKVEAENYYNNLGKTLAGFSTDYYNSDINSYIGAIEKYGQMYSANRLLARAQAEAAATKYSGLAQAAVSNANAVASRYNNNYYQQLYDYYNATGDPNPARTVQSYINGQYKYSNGGGS